MERKLLLSPDSQLTCHPNRCDQDRCRKLAWTVQPLTLGWPVDCPLLLRTRTAQSHVASAWSAIDTVSCGRSHSQYTALSAAGPDSKNMAKKLTADAGMIARASGAVPTHTNNARRTVTSKSWRISTRRAYQ